MSINDKPTLNERLLLHYIKAFSDNNRNVFQTNKKLADMLDLSEASISSMISRLVANGYLNKFKVDGVRNLKYTGKEFKQIPSFMPINRTDYNTLKKQVKKLTTDNVTLTFENKALKEEVEELRIKLKALTKT